MNTGFKLYTSVFVNLVSPQKLVLARCYTQIENIHLAFFLWGHEGVGWVVYWTAVPDRDNFSVLPFYRRLHFSKTLFRSNP